MLVELYPPGPGDVPKVLEDPAGPDGSGLRPGFGDQLTGLVAVAGGEKSRAEVHIGVQGP